jgi:hypothetical protein
VSRADDARAFAGAFFSPDVAVAAVKVALFVGTVLNLINQGNRILDERVHLDLARLALNYLVPYCVSSWSGAAAVRRAARRHAV